MKKIIIVLSILIVASSIFYYFVIFLSKQAVQNKNFISDYNKQKTQLLNSLGQSNKELSKELKCVLDINSKWEALLSKECPDSNSVDWMNCREDVIKSAEFKAITCN
jgi:hypothetical protein